MRSHTDRLVPTKPAGVLSRQVVRTTLTACCPTLLPQVLQAMDPPRRRVVIFKGGGYIYAEMEALIEAAGGDFGAC